MLFPLFLFGIAAPGPWGPVSGWLGTSSAPWCRWTMARGWRIS